MKKYSVIFPSGRIEFFTVESVAHTFALAYKGTFMSVESLLIDTQILDLIELIEDHSIQQGKEIPKGLKLKTVDELEGILCLLEESCQ